MEEDIKLLKEMKENCLKKRTFYIDDKAEKKAMAIDNIINRNKELEERNIYLVNERKKLEELLFMSNENYIEKSKAREKVIEIKNKPVKDNFITASQGKLDTIIAIEELLED